MEPVVDKNAILSEKNEKLSAVLILLKDVLKDMSYEVDASSKLLEVGLKTDLSKKVESELDKNPIERIFTTYSVIDNSVKNILNKIFIEFLKNKSHLISKAFRTKTTLNDLHYSIVLNEDTMENRVEIYSFLDEYDLIEGAIGHPIYIQFIPSSLIEKLENSESIEL